VLAAHNGPAGICPGVPRLAEVLGVSVRYVRERLAELEGAGLVERIYVFETNDDPQWRRRGRRISHARRQTSSTYRLAQFRGPPGTPTNLVEKATPQATPPELGVADSPVSSALEGKEQAVSGYHPVDEGEVASDPIEIAVEPPESALLDHDPSAAEVLATLTAAFGHVQVLSGPATYRTARGRVIDLETCKAADVHQALDQLRRHTCVNGACQSGKACRRHTPRRRPK
jgi:hypothetical protein